MVMEVSVRDQFVVCLKGGAIWSTWDRYLAIEEQCWHLEQTMHVGYK
jgi:hypothetical protein